MGGEAPRDRRLYLDTWAPGQKQAFGTAFTYDAPAPVSRVWFTAARGALTEVYYPTLDTANVRQLHFVVSDGRSFTVAETDLSQVDVVRPDERSLRYRIRSASPEYGFVLHKEIVTDPAHDALLMRVHLETQRDGLRLYLYLDPRLGNTGDHNSALVEPGVAFAWAGDLALALKTTASWRGCWAGFKNYSDGMRELMKGHRPGPAYASASDGRVGILIDFGLPAEPFTLALGFGTDRDTAVREADAALVKPFHEIAAEYDRGWHAYTSRLTDWPALAQKKGVASDATAPLYWASMMFIKAAEDKTQAGAAIASPSHPWGDTTRDDPHFRGYRLVWPRDLYHTAMALIAAGDRASANGALGYLASIQRQDGSFPQNVFLDGRHYWPSTQMDEVADPILLAWWLGRDDLYHTMVKRAAEYILAEGPATPQERWEESPGYSPATIAAEIAALVAAADMADRLGLESDARRYLASADAWQGRVEDWTVTRTGPLLDVPYYIRIAPNGDPDDAATYTVANGVGDRDQRAVVDPSYLELVRLGVKSPGDRIIRNSLVAVDTLRVRTPNGPSWYRYTDDGYGDPDTPSGRRRGRLWVLLTGERGMYHLAAGETDQALEMLRAMERFASDGRLLAEQVWEKTGTGTGSATPLIWSHAEYVVLLASLVEGRPLDTPHVVAARYAHGK